MVYYCIFCGKRLNRRKKKYCSNSCKCKQFYKEFPEKCNLWNKRNLKPKVNNKCLTCGTPCGRKKYCSEECKPKMIYIPQIKRYWEEIERLNAKCNICKKTFFTCHIHHINGDHSDNKKENLLPVCPTCHNKIHTKKQHFKRLLKKEIENILESYRNKLQK